MKIFTFVGICLDFILDIILPRFKTEDFLIMYTDAGIEIIEIVGTPETLLVDPEIDYDEIMQVRYFNLFGFGLFPKFYQYVTEEEEG